MTDRFAADRKISSWLASERPSAPPEGLLEAVIRNVGTTARRPGWRIADRWSWRHTARLRVAARTVILVAILTALALTALWIVGVGSRQPSPPFGLTRAGLIAFDTAEGIVVARADGTDRHVIVKPSGTSISPTWSRDGLHLAYWHRPGTSGPWSLMVVDPDGSAPSLLADGVTLEERETILNQPSNISWSPDSRQIAFAGDIEAGGQGIFMATLGQTGATLITDPALRAIDPAWKPDGSVIAFQSQQTGTLHVIAPDGTREHELANLPNTNLWPDWSADGSLVATMAFVPNPDNPESGQTEVFTVSADGATVTNISRDPADRLLPVVVARRVAPRLARIPEDGSARAFIVIAQPDGPNVVEIRIDADLAPPVWAPDATRVFSYVQAQDGTFSEVIVIDPSGVAPLVRLPAEGNIGNGNWQRLP